jgi:two-component system, OmpR family, sensor histidine kinase ChvG
MALDIATANTKRAADKSARETSAAPASLPARRYRRGRLSPLTRRILFVNLLAIGLLGVGLLYLGEYQDSLIATEIQALTTQGQIFAAALGEGAVIDIQTEGETLIPELGRDMMRRLVEPTRTRALLFDDKGILVSDTKMLRGPVGAVEITELPPPDEIRPMRRILRQIYTRVLGVASWHDRYPLAIEHIPPLEADYPEVGMALAGDVGSAVRETKPGGLVITVAVPVQRYKHVLGAVLLSEGSAEIEQTVRAVRLEILKVFGVALAVTVLLSIYLAGTIAQPIRRLAAAAERVRRVHGREVAIPDLTARGDEIGDLSHALRDMTSALAQRMGAIERFAADVAHEIKNPLTSLASAVETAVRVADPEKQRRLLALVLDDIRRIDRLITDISDASRLDAEMSRDEPAPVAIAPMLETLVEVYGASGSEDAPQLALDLPESAIQRAALEVPGIESRLVQVFRNLIANAISFSPKRGTIRIRAERRGGEVVVSIEDEGPGIPEGKLQAIFERFYSERPAGEKFGTHSGLGLSISQQIIAVHHGTIIAENRRTGAGAPQGARFTVRLPVA